MPQYRLYRLRDNDRIIDAVEIEVADDEAAFVEAILLDHAPIIEIWAGNRRVGRVAPAVNPVIQPPSMTPS